MNKRNIYLKGANVEFKIENYLENNLDIIETGLRLVQRQYKLYYKSKNPIGIIDLFCQGEDKAQVIVELKSRELGARDLGQVLAYYAVCKKRADSYSLPPPRLYCIGLSIGQQYHLGLTLLNDGNDINLTTQTYTLIPTTSYSDKEFSVTLNNYNSEYNGTLTIPL